MDILFLSSPQPLVTHCTNITPNYVGSNNYYCSLPQEPVMEEIRQEFLEDIILDNVEYDCNEELYKKEAEDFAFAMLQENQNWLDLDSESDAMYVEYYSAKSEGNAGLIQQMKDYITEEDDENALLILESIIPENEYEENLLTCFDIFINFDMNEVEYTGSEVGILETFAYGDYYEIGEAVFMARAMLNLILDDEGNEQRMKSANVSYKDSNVKLYPNPAQNILSIDFLYENLNSKIQIIDIYGRMVYENYSNEHKIIIDISFLKSGIYFCNIISNDQQKSSMKFIKK